MNISKIRKVHCKKLGSLSCNNSYFESVTSHDPEKVLFNFSSHQLTEHEKSLLSRGLNFGSWISFLDSLFFFLVDCLDGWNQ